jgi:CheY-like chemotaxis protein
LLDASRIISGKLSVEAHLLDLAPVIKAALEAVRPSAESKSQRLHFTNKAGALRVRGDAARLQQVAVNLLSNAVKFTPPDGQVTITLSAVSRPPDATNGATPRATPAGFARLTVSDTGRGISPDFLPFVFERFRQADTSTRRAVSGLGLGLAIVRHLVEMHGGTVWAASEGEGRGATFTVELPLARVPAQDQATKPGEVVPTSRPHIAPTRADLAGVRVLVVEDDADTRDVLTLVLNEAGAEVTVAASAAEGLQKLEAERPDVLLSDIGLPDRDGFDLIRQVRALPPERGGHTLAAALTAYARSEDRLRALAAGFHSHLVKPVEPGELILVVRSLAGRA